MLEGQQLVNVPLPSWAGTCSRVKECSGLTTEGPPVRFSPMVFWIACIVLVDAFRVWLKQRVNGEAALDIARKADMQNE